VWFFLGRNAAIMGLLCMLGALVPLALVALFLGVIGWIVRRANEQ
jgi:hypothetical protein